MNSPWVGVLLRGIISTKVCGLYDDPAVASSS